MGFSDGIPTIAMPPSLPPATTGNPSGSPLSRAASAVNVPTMVADGTSGGRYAGRHAGQRQGLLIPLQRARIEQPGGRRQAVIAGPQAGQPVENGLFERDSTRQPRAEVIHTPAQLGRIIENLQRAARTAIESEWIGLRHGAYAHCDAARWSAQVRAGANG